MTLKRSPKLRPTLWDGVAAAVILAVALGLGGYFWTLGHGDGDLTAILSVDGQEQERIALTSLDGEETRTITANGYTLQLVLTPETVTVSDADCPTQDCVRTGVIRRGGQSIVCLPARVVVTLSGGTDANAPDLVIG